MDGVRWSDAVEAFELEYGALDAVIPHLDHDQLLAPSACLGWTRADLIYHLLLDAQRALVTFASPAEGPPDKDFVSYWQDFTASDDASRAHARFVRISAAAHSDPRAIAARWHETARAAVRSSRTTGEITFVTTQSHVLTTANFIATLVVEATVHHLDLIAGLKHRPSPVAPALSITVATLEGLLGRARPSRWDELTFVLKATGRQPLTEDDRAALAESAARFPLFS